MPLIAQAEELAELLPPLLLDAHRVADTVAMGLHGRRQAGVGEHFWQHRPYSIGDPVSAIDWRQSARMSERLYVRENEWENAGRCWFWHPRNAAMDYASAPDLPTKSDRATLLLSALAVLLHRAGERIGLLNAHSSIYSGANAPQRFIDQLISTPALATFTHLPTRMRPADPVILAGDFFVEQPALETLLRPLAATQQRGFLLWVIDPAEEEFPFTERTRFQHPHTGESMTVDHPAQLHRDYQHLFQAHHDMLRQLAASFGWHLIAHRSDTPPHQALLSLFTALSAGYA